MRSQITGIQGMSSRVDGSPKSNDLPKTRTALVVLGMHRSGTSALTRVLSMLGADLPRELHPPGPDNSEGFWESAKLVRVHEEMLAAAGSSWHDAGPVPAFWENSHFVEPYRERIVSVLREDYGASRFLVIKDPRIARFVPLICTALEDVDAEPKFVLALRNPLEVAASLKARGGFPFAKSFILWLDYMLRAERVTRSYPRAFVLYENLITDWQGVMQSVARRLHVEFPTWSAGNEAEIHAFLNPNLRHHRYNMEELRARQDVGEWVRVVYDAMCTLASAEDTKALERLDRVFEAFDTAQRTFGVLVAHEQRARREQVRKSEEVGRLAEDRDRQIRANAARIAELEDSVAKSVARVEDQKKSLERLQSRLRDVKLSRDQACERASASKRELDAYMAQVAGLESAVEAHKKSAEEGRGRLERLHQELDQSVRAREESQRIAAAREAELQRAQECIANLNAAVAEQQESIKKNVGRLQDLQSELDEMAARTAAFERQLARRAEDYKSLRDRLQRTKSKLRRRTAERDRAEIIGRRRKKELVVKKLRVAELEGVLQAREARINALLSSTSWRVSAPLRKVSSVVRGVKRKLTHWMRLKRSSMHSLRAASEATQQPRKSERTSKTDRVIGTSCRKTEQPADTGTITAAETTIALDPPARQRMDGKNLRSISRDRGHLWYRTRNLQDFLVRYRNENFLPDHLRRLLVIAHDFKFRTGVTRPISHYLNAMASLGSLELTSIELARGAPGSVAQSYIDNHDFVIVNSVAPFFAHDGLIDVVKNVDPHRMAVYLHETAWVFDKLRTEYPERFVQFARALRDFNVLCVSQAQEAWLKEEFGVSSTSVVYNTSILPKLVPKNALKRKLRPNSPLVVMMAGTQQPRKGTSLFSQVADLAHEVGLPWRFRWAGRQVCKDDEIYKSPRVEWLGDLDANGMFEALTAADIFFLSSQDDPFPLCVLEALLAYKRVVAYRASGAAEILQGDEAPAVVFKEYGPEAALRALQEVVKRRVARASFETINETLSPSSFVSRMNSGISRFMSATKLMPPCRASAVRRVSMAERRPVLLMCNGPSASEMREPCDLDKYHVARMNFFFLEPTPFAAGRVDDLFWGVNEPNFHAGLREAILSGRYRVERFNSPLPPERMSYPNRVTLAERPFFQSDKLRDHWQVIAREPELARLMMTRPLPTTGLQAMAALACSGHRRFAVAGMDFYAENTGSRYFYDVSDELRSKLASKHLTPGYEAGAHSREVDLRFLGALLEIFPELKIEMLSEMPVLRDFLHARHRRAITVAKMHG